MCDTSEMESGCFTFLATSGPRRVSTSSAASPPQTPPQYSFLSPMLLHIVRYQDHATCQRYDCTCRNPAGPLSWFLVSVARATGKHLGLGGI